MSIEGDIRKLEPGARIIMYELDARNIGASLLGWHGHLQSGPIIWQGESYDPWGVEIKGLAISGERPARPQLSVSNINSVISSLCINFQGLVGAKLTIKSTLIQYLDAVNFPDGNPSADPDEHFPDEIWFIERKVSERPGKDVTFELVSAADFNDQQLPGRQIQNDQCPWLTRGGYRGPYCGYAGPPVADINDNPTDDPSRDVCGGRVKSCKLRFGENNELNHGGFPGAGLIRS